LKELIILKNIILSMKKIIENAILEEKKLKELIIQKKLFLDNLYEFSTQVLGYELLTENVHKRWSDNLTKSKSKRKLYLKPRGTYKTTLYAISYPLWRALKNPEIRIAICGSNAENANSHIRTIQKHILYNKKFIEIFGNLYNKKLCWTQSSFSISLRKNFQKKENNFTALGFGSQMTGKHFDLIIADDIVNNDDRESYTIRKKKERWFQDIISILEPNGEILIIGTRWHTDDFYNYIINDLNKKLPDESKYNIEIETAINEMGEPNYPTILPLSKLETLKLEKGIIEFNSQYMNSPLSEGTRIFYESDFNYFEYNNDFENLINIAYLDPSMGKNYTSDYSALIIGNFSKDNTLLILDAVIARVLPDILIELMIEKIKKYNIKFLGVESNSFQEYLVDVIESKLSEINIRIIKIKNFSNKEVRIQSLQPLIKNGQIKFRKDAKIKYPILIEQLLLFPLASNDDAPDALEGLYSLSRKLINKNEAFHNEFDNNPIKSRIW